MGFNNSDDKVIKKISRFVIRHKGLTAIIAVGTVGGVIVAYSRHAIKKYLHIPTHVIETEKSKEYIYAGKNVDQYFSNGNRNKGSLSIHARQFIKELLPAPIARFILMIDKKAVDLSEDYITPWSVLHQAYSRNQNIRLRAVETIASYKDWNDEKRQEVKKAKRKKLEDCITSDEIEIFDLDAEFRTLAQALDPVTSVCLARTNDVDLRLFLPPPQLPPLQSELDIEDLLRETLVELPQGDMEQCIRYFTTGALQLSDEQKQKRGGLWCFDGNGINYTREIRPQEDVELLCLQALVKHSLHKEHCEAMIKLGILQLLQRIRILRPNNPKIQENIVRIVSNICLYEGLHSQVFQSGWISLLAETSNSTSVALRVQASRGLANLDRENVKEKYEDGVYVLYPRHLTKLHAEADVVFVHGLMGGAFYSWRQKYERSSKDKEITECWPEDWLPQDLPGSRIMCVEYDTNVSEWMQLCPYENEKRSISYRSRQLLDNLLKAGIGDKPIVWVTHSMGGLIVKHMLLDAVENKKKYGNVLQRTKGLVFFSTPHAGSQLAKSSLNIKRLFFPSIEVMELSHDSPTLARLNENLKELVGKFNIQVLSFGETQSTDIGFGKLVKLDIVSPQSANPGVGTFISLDTNHLNVCKPTSRQSPVYLQTVKSIRSAIEGKSKTESSASHQDTRVEPDLEVIL